jgi:L-lysine 2,3-aminomutase
MNTSKITTIKSFDRANDVLVLIAHLRWIYFRKNSTSQVRKILNQNKIQEPIYPNMSTHQLMEVEKIVHENSLDWGDWNFHVRNRLHLNRDSSQEDFSRVLDLIPLLKPDSDNLWKLVKKGVEIQNNNKNNPSPEKRFYDFSIMPLNVLLDDSVIKYFIPSNDYLEEHITKKDDPYGIISGKSRSKVGTGTSAIIINKQTKSILGTHKFSHTLLFNVDFYCPIGCSNCYKTRMGTREYLDYKLGSKSKIYDHEDLGQLVPPSKGQVQQQAKDTVAWMNQDPRGQQVYDVIISGGEPLWMSNDSIKVLLDVFKLSENLKILRICTGMLFLGVPFRFDEELLDILKRFSEETGVRVTIQAHLGNHHMISPETVIAVQKIRQHGISIYSQIPIKNGINFFLDDLDKTMEYLVRLGRTQVSVGIEPYMFIVDMHPSTNADYVPLEPLMQVWGMLVESHDYPGLERPRTLSVLFEGGNIILSGHTLFSARKEIDLENERVIYHIPRVSSVTSWQAEISEVFSYEEPLIEGINDDPNSLHNLQEKMKC